MRYSINGDFYRVMRVTGPTHNLLGLSFTKVPPETVAVERLGSPSEHAIDEDQLKRAVLSGVDHANASLQTDFHVSRIHYVPTDTPDPEIYSYLARQIVDRLASGAAFSGTGNEEGCRAERGQRPEREQEPNRQLSDHAVR